MMPAPDATDKPVAAEPPASGAQGSSTLDELALRIRTASQAARAAWTNALGHVLDAGDALNEAQGRVSTGWKKWLKRNCFLGTSTAQLYQQLARHREEIETEMARVPELSLRAARRLISKPPSKNAPKLNKPDRNLALKITAVLRKALSLIKTANTPGISAAVASSNKHEAVAALQQLAVLLVRGGFALNDITINTAKAAPKSRRHAA